MSLFQLEAPARAVPEGETESLLPPVTSTVPNRLQCGPDSGLMTSFSPHSQPIEVLLLSPIKDKEQRPGEAQRGYRNLFKITWVESNEARLPNQVALFVPTREMRRKHVIKLSAVRPQLNELVHIMVVGLVAMLAAWFQNAEE